MAPAREWEWAIPPECIPDFEAIAIDDGKAVEIRSEKNMRLLTEPLYASWPGPGEGRPFLALANVGLFHTLGEPPLVPDVMLSLDVRCGDLSQKKNRSYFVYVFGKFPEVVVEIVSNREGGEDTGKLREYARLRIPYYVIFDPENLLGGGVLRLYEFHVHEYRPRESAFLDGVGLGLQVWAGAHEGMTGTWLRWCDRDSRLIPTGAEAREQERRRAEQERQRAEQALEEVERLRARVRELEERTPPA